MSQPINNEEDLQKILKNEAVPSDEFRDSLRNRLLSLAQSSKTERKSFMPNIFSSKILAGLATVAAVAVLAVIVQSNVSPLNISSNKVASHQGFGQLPSLAQTEGLGSGGGGGINAPVALEGKADTAAAPSDVKIAIMPVPPDGEYLPPVVTYNINAALPEVENEMLVYRERGLLADRDFLDFITNATQINFLRRYASANIENLSFTLPNSPYHFNIDQFGRYSMWGSFNDMYMPIPPSDIPSDDEIIRIANQFVDEQGIDRSQFGEPYVDNTWREYYYMRPALGVEVDAASIIAPYQITVGYPMTIDNMPLVGWNGAPDPGISVNVNIAQKRADGLSGRWQSNRDQSLYPTTAQDKVLEHAKRGGINPLWGYWVSQLTPEQEARRPKIDVHLDKIELGYLQQYKYNSGSNTPESYLIPVYAFTGNYVDQNGNSLSYGTIVPAIDGNFFEENPYQILEKPMPMPVEGNGGTGSSGSSIGSAESVDPEESTVLPAPDRE